MTKNESGRKETREVSELKSSLNLPEQRSDRIARIITDFFGSVTFLVICILFFTGWISYNLGLFTGKKGFDPFPFPALEMVVSVFAIILSVSVLINQKRQSHQQKINQQVEFEVNIRAENEITRLLRMLHEIQHKLGIKTSDEELEDMKKDLDIKQIHQKLDEGQGQS